MSQFEFVTSQERIVSTFLAFLPIMKVELIKQWAIRFAKHLRESPQKSKFFKWESQENFSQQWKLGTDHFYEVYDQSLQSQHTTRLWEGSKHSGKSAMLLFIEHNPAFCESMFRDLFDEKNDIGLRLNRFIYHCDQMLAEIKSKHPKVVSHHHDYRLLSVYLSFRYPKSHCIFHSQLFAQAGEKFGLRKAPEPFEYDRFQKLTKGLATVISGIQEVRAAYPFEIDDQLTLVHDFYEFVAETRS